MKKDIKLRTLKEADYIIDTKKTIREVAKEFNISKSTVHKDINERLEGYDKNRHKEIKEIMQNHIDIRHIRGGIATHNKYKLEKK